MCEIQPEYYCKECDNRIEHDDKTCEHCGAVISEKGRLIKVALEDRLSFASSLRNHYKAGQEVRGKPLEEILDYLGTKDPNIQSRIIIERLNRETVTVHQLFKKMGKTTKKVHEHIKHRKAHNR